MLRGSPLAGLDGAGACAEPGFRERTALEPPEESPERLLIIDRRRVAPSGIHEGDVHLFRPGDDDPGGARIDQVLESLSPAKDEVPLLPRHPLHIARDAQYPELLEIEQAGHLLGIGSESVRELPAELLHRIEGRRLAAPAVVRA